MSKITITLNDNRKIPELLLLFSELPYIVATSIDDPDLMPNGIDQETDDSNHVDTPFYQDPRTSLMDNEIAAYEAMYDALSFTYPEQYVAIFSGAVIDHDQNMDTLLGRLAQSHPHEVVLVRRVSVVQRAPFRLRSPRLERP